ncbi:MAG: hypothetical protein CL878_09540 [Dehalococcoidia bacterium]|nr:hypothetical protein [Dehalococcoidia bacterium]
MPRWIEPTLHRTRGLDPLGLQTITIDRILPRLVPGVLALSRRARYLSYYPFLLHEYQERRLTSSNQALSDWIKAREYEYALAVQLCPRGCGSKAVSVVGRRRAAPAAQHADGVIARGESVQSFLGGYGLYYRTPLTDLGLVAPAGSSLSDDTLTPVDVLMGDHAQSLATEFHQVVSGTTYYTAHMTGTGPIPVEVLRELAESACLCRLSDYPAEQELLRQALFEPRPDKRGGAVQQRQRSFALFLGLLDQAPGLVGQEDPDATFRGSIWQQFDDLADDDNPQAETLAQWAALVAKEYLQEGLAGLWSHFCREGLARQLADGLAPGELDDLVRRGLAGAGSLALPGGSVQHEPTLRTRFFADSVLAATAALSLEELRSWSSKMETAMAGLALLLVLQRRLPEARPIPPRWTAIAGQRSDHQPSLHEFGYGQLPAHLDTNPTLADTMAWLVHRFVRSPHETIAYSKLPNFTFRFRWEEGRLRFYSAEDNRFGLVDIRRESMARLTEDLGYWADAEGTAQLTPLGHAFISEVFA